MIKLQQSDFTAFAGYYLDQILENGEDILIKRRNIWYKISFHDMDRSEKLPPRVKVKADNKGARRGTAPKPVPEGFKSILPEGLRENK